MTKELFVVICMDRHTDDVITVHATRASADAEIDRFKAEYERDGVTWHEQDYGRDQGWVRYVDSHDEGPKARIELTEIRGA